MAALKPIRHPGASREPASTAGWALAFAGATCAAALLSPSAMAAGVITYVETAPATCPTARCEALGYAVPLPVDSQLPVDGFRHYTALLARLQDLALASSDIAEREVGRTLNDRPILAFTLGDADATTVDGVAEPAALQNGGIHAREWASPEVVGGIIERFAANAGDAGLYRYLLDNLAFTLIPVLNVDGFLQTQRYPDTALTTEFSEDPAGWPRDGRMRRKNMRNADEDLATQNDFLLGVDNNRNNDTQFWGNGNQNSNDARSLVHHGGARGSEPETQALYEAARLAPESRLRFYIDTHSFSRIFYSADTGNARHDALQRALAQTMQRVTGNRYAYGPTPPNVGIGSTDEYFAYRYQIPAYTLEIEPGPNGAVDYGGFSVSHDGFILPENQIARVRDELADAVVAGAYRMAGPPSVSAVQIRERASGTAVYQARWLRDSATTRQIEVSVRNALANEVDYTLWIAFDKPMRVRDGGGAIAQYRGQSVPLAPRIQLEGVNANGGGFGFAIGTTTAGWRAAAGGAPAGFARYRDDAFGVDFRVPATTPLTNASRMNLLLDVQDFTGQHLDANPATAVDLVNGGWSGYEDTNGNASTDTGGEDRSLRMVDDGSPLFGASPQPAASGGGGGALSHWSVLLMAMLAGLRRRLGKRISS